MTIKQAINNSNIDFISARNILSYVLRKDKKYIIINNEEELNATDFNKFEEYVKALKNGKPIQYITNTQEFMGEDFYVNENVLIPQPDTEVLVEQSILKIQEIINRKGKAIVLDLCTGSGAIAISLKKHFLKDIEVYASDISEKALEVAKINMKNILGKKHEIKEDEKNIIGELASDSSNKITFIKSDMFDNINLKFDIIVSNPPYIKTKVITTLSAEVQNEPKLALDGGEDGFKFYRIIRENVEKYLNDVSYVLMEIGYDQKEVLLDIFENAKCVQDYAGNDRVIIWRRNTKNE